MLMMLLALFFAATASHQITPFMMLGVLTALPPLQADQADAGRCRSSSA